MKTSYMSRATTGNQWYDDRQRVTINDNERQWVTTNVNKCNGYPKNKKVTPCSNHFITNFKVNLSICFSAFSTIFKQFLTNSLKLKMTYIAHLRECSIITSWLIHLPLYHYASSRKIRRTHRYPTHPAPPILPLYHLFLYFWCFKIIKNQSYAPTHGTSIHVFKCLKQVVRFGLPYKEKRKRKLCARATFYASVQTGSILSNTGVPDPCVISGIAFSAPSKSTSSMAYYSL